MPKQAKNLYQLKKNNKNTLIFLHLEGCPWCHFVDLEVISPMNELIEYTSKLNIRSIEINAGKTLIDFNNTHITANKFADNNNIDFYPTLLLFNAKGKLLNQVIGVTNKDFYWSDLDKVIDMHT